MGNVSSSHYFFAASTTDQGATLAKGTLTTTGNGTEVIGSFSFPSGSTPSSPVLGGVVQNLLGGSQSYTFYVQACPGSAALDSALCSNWARIGTRSTLPYPAGTVVFPAPVAPGDATVNTIAARTAVPTADLGNVSLIRLDIHDLINAANNQTLAPIGFTGNGTYPINNTMYTQNGGFKPNVKYEYVGKVVYPYGVDVPAAAGQQLRGPFWTTPRDPFNVTRANITHCSVQITAENSNGAPANPAYTPYSLCAGGLCQTQAIGGPGLPTDSLTLTITGLQPNTAYTPNARANVGNGVDASANAWNDSGLTNGTAFTTLNWGGTFSVSGVTTTSAVYNISNIIGAGSIVSYQVTLNGSNYTGPGGSGPGAPPATVTLTGLTPNTAYTVRIILTEATCPSPPIGAVTFTTTAATPTGFDLTAVAPRQMSATWAANGNPAATDYRIRYCRDAAFTQNCQPLDILNTTSAPSITTGVFPESTYFADVTALTIGGGQNSADSNDDSVTTPNENPTVAVPNCSVVNTQANCSVAASDVGTYGVDVSTQLHYSWAVTPSAGATINPNNQVNNNATVISFPGNGSYAVSVTVTDHFGAGPGVVTRQTTVNIGQTPTSLDPIVPAAATVVVGFNQSFSIVVRDQFGAPIPNGGVDWSVSGGGSLNPVLSSSFTVFTAGSSVGSPFTLTATLPSNPGVTRTATLTVNPSGPIFTQLPTITLNANGVTGNVNAAAIDNSPGATPMVYTWSLESGLGAVSFGPNASPSANNALATFTQAGTYVIRCTISDNYGSNFAVTPSTTIVQVLTSVSLCPIEVPGCPNTITVKALRDQQFTVSAFDQFGDAVPVSASDFSWSAVGCSGCINSAGVFNASAIGRQFTVTATHTQTGKQGSALVTVISFDVSGAYAYPVPFKSTQASIIHFKNLGSSAKIRIYTPTGRKVFSVETNSDTYDWNVKNSSSENIASGVYFYVIESPEGKKDGKLIIVQ